MVFPNMAKHSIPPSFRSIWKLNSPSNLKTNPQTCAVQSPVHRDCMKLGDTFPKSKWINLCGFETRASRPKLGYHIVYHVQINEGRQISNFATWIEFRTLLNSVLREWHSCASIRFLFLNCDLHTKFFGPLSNLGSPLLGERDEKFA